MIRFVTVPAIAAAIIAGSATAGAAPVAAQNVTITLTDVRTDAGDLSISLQTAEQFMTDGAVQDRIIVNPQDGTLTVTFQDVAPGAYSFTVWHDIDRDGTFSMGPMGPTDGWAMPGGAQLRGAPTFAANSFTVTAESVTITEPMIYGMEFGQ